ncbi:Uncharacterised protein [Mycobacteroides abscessus subsp. bolletii]|uniref:Uncharacterized protein n=1 Tax=Mycobacteroides abscessus subsp. bolletii TaxID=319705 RepID=A0A9Q7SIK0_9MYCO|nr:hypothetical protein [Mycobacteroides abscessus]MBN7301288.1 hypothetical protein [Mycobacteroides abscessus subsp. bolletii]ORA28354.1 hypothetical protein BST18_09780 [Mycobacteroides abscessus subsp. bolletii]TPF66545.1 hypothetical protein XW60_19340 [Mycobacteroides abscessus subsp. bolletii]SHU70164.1 Uncharacterised protein [Mycobacteroides abscessus subsp. bolletii]SHV01416.1 Uncharacterised protein [Mycobacteroides abscessus subsp. bolletii]
MTSGIDNWRDSFVESVVRMAASPEIQISHLQELGVGTDELALEFDSLYVPERLSLTDRQSVYAVDLDRLLTAMSEAPDVGQWSYEGLQSDDRWAEVRLLAAELLASLRVSE